MRDEDRTKEELLEELTTLRNKISELEHSSVDSHKTLFTSEAFQTMYENHGSIMYIVDLSTFRVVDANNAALKFYGYDLETMCKKRIPDLNTTPENEILAEVKSAVAEGRSYYLFKHRLANGDIRDVEIYANPILIDGKEYSFSIVHDVTEHKRVDDERDRLIEKLQSALDEIKDLRGIIPICSFCKKVRDDQGFWSRVEDYIQEHSDIDFSHSLCPDCARDHYPELFEKSE